MNGATLEVQNVSKITREKGRLLRDISLFLKPGEIVALVSQSEGSQALLFEILLGRTRPAEGRVMVGGNDIYQSQKRPKQIVGFVAKDDILPAELTVSEVLHDAAEIRIPKSVSGEARIQRVEQLLDEFDLAGLQKLRLKALPPEQRKWVHIAVELVSNPGVLLLDEPDCGLGPGGDDRLARLLRKLAEQDLAILLSAGSSTNVLSADRVFVLLDGGYLGWYGPPGEARMFFNNQAAVAQANGNGPELVEALAGLRVAGESEAQAWAERFRSHPAYKTYLSPPKKEKQPELILDERPLAHRTEKPAPEAPPPSPLVYSSYGQLVALLLRSLTLLARDRISLILLLVLPVLAGAIDAFLTYRQMYDPVFGSAERILLALALMIFSIMLLSGIPWIREMGQEVSLLRRERQISLKTIPFLLSKTWVAGFTALYQSFIWTLIYFLLVNVPGGLIAGIFFFITLFLVSLCGAFFALLASNLVRSKAEAGLVFLVLLLVQVLFSGGLRPFAGPSTPLGALASALPVTMALHSLVAAGVQGIDLSASDCSKNNILTICDFPGARRFLQSAGNTGEGGLLTPLPSPPLQPFPPTPSPEDTVETYRGKVESFIAEIEPWSLNLFTYATILTRNSFETENAEDQIRNEFSRFGPAWSARQSSQWIGLLLSAAIILLLFSWTMKFTKG